MVWLHVCSQIVHQSLTDLQPRRFSEVTSLPEAEFSSYYQHFLTFLRLFGSFFGSTASIKSLDVTTRVLFPFFFFFIFKALVWLLRQQFVRWQFEVLQKKKRFQG